MAILIYLDDIILVGDHVDQMNQVKKFLDEKFKIKDLGQLSFFMGLEITRSKKGIHINQRKYALDILADRGMLAAKPCSTPMTKDAKFVYEQSELIHEEEAYRHTIGRLLYLTNKTQYKFSSSVLESICAIPECATSSSCESRSEINKRIT